MQINEQYKTSLPKVIWEEGCVAAKVSYGPVWQRGRNRSPEDAEFTTLHQLVPLLWAKPAYARNIRGHCGSVSVSGWPKSVSFGWPSTIMLPGWAFCETELFPDIPSHLQAIVTVSRSRFLQTLGNSLVVFTKSGDVRASCTGGAGLWWLLLSLLQPGSRSRNSTV